MTAAPRVRLVATAAIAISVLVGLLISIVLSEAVLVDVIQKAATAGGYATGDALGISRWTKAIDALMSPLQYIALAAGPLILIYGGFRLMTGSPKGAAVMASALLGLLIVFGAAPLMA